MKLKGNGLDQSWKKYQRLRLVAFSCHEAALNVLNDWAARIIPGLRFHLYEYFLETPSPKHDPAPSPQMFVPFVDREVASRGFCLAIPTKPNAEKEFLDQIISLVGEASKKSISLSLPLGFSSHIEPLKLVQRLRRLGPLSFGRISNKLYESWKRDKSIIGEGNSWSNSFRSANRASCLKEMSEKLNDASLEVSVRLGWANIFSILYTPLLARPTTRDKLFFVGVPIASPLAFYGVLTVAVEVPSHLKHLRDESILKELVLLVERFYLPTLILTQNSWEEEQLSNVLSGKKPIKIDWNREFDESVPFQRRVYSNPRLHSHLDDRVIDPVGRYQGQSAGIDSAARANFDLEKDLIALWRRRLNSPHEKVSKSLIFSKLMIASPGMLASVRDILKATPAIAARQRADDPLPSVLVIGSPGAGKEKVADLVPLFTEHYWDAQPVKLNMAAISETEDIAQYIKKQAPDKDKAVLFLDELNSLDIRAQGGLLRILEKGEFPQPNENSSDAIDWLIVGLINEEPDQLTLGEIRERTRDTFVFGQFVGALLYEHFKTRSRMRDDLYYRIRRSGEIRVLDLDQRREDIPILLYFLLSRTSKSFDVFLAYDALTELINSGLAWKGNVRQLELVAREVMSILTKATGRIRPVTATVIRAALLNARVPGVHGYRMGHEA